MIELAGNVWHVCSLPLIVLISALVSLALLKSFRIPFQHGIVLFIWHLLLCLIYLTYTFNDVADARHYYLASLETSSLSVGTGFIVSLSSIFSSLLGFSYPGVFLVYNLFGTIGLLALYGALRQVTKAKTQGVKWLSFIVVALPSVSFWSSAIGKDSIAFMAIGLSLWASLALKERKLLMAFAIFAMFLVRPHMAGLMIIALSVAVFFDRQSGLGLKILIGLVSLGVAAVLVPFAMKYAGLVDIVNLMDYIDQRQGYNQEGGGGMDISSMSFPMQLFTYAFRPLPFEAHNLMALLSSIDNLVLLFVCSLGLYGWFRNGVQGNGANVVFLVVYIIGAWSILAVTTANLGIAVRQKWMFMPYLILLAFCCLQKVPFRINGSQRTPSLNSAH